MTGSHRRVLRSASGQDLSIICSKRRVRRRTRASLWLPTAAFPQAPGNSELTPITSQLELQSLTLQLRSSRCYLTHRTHPDSNFSSPPTWPCATGRDSDRTDAETETARTLATGHAGELSPIGLLRGGSPHFPLTCHPASHFPAGRPSTGAGGNFTTSQAEQRLVPELEASRTPGSRSSFSSIHRRAHQGDRRPETASLLPPHCCLHFAKSVCLGRGRVASVHSVCLDSSQSLLGPPPCQNRIPPMRRETEKKRRIKCTWKATGSGGALEQEG